MSAHATAMVSATWLGIANAPGKHQKQFAASDHDSVE
jgi:hypothetical protein